MTAASLPTTERPNWPQQDYAFAATTEAIEAGETAICLTTPTGGGKGKMIEDLIQWSRSRNMGALLLTHRRLLTSQTIARFDEAGIYHGVMASGYRPALLRDVQIASIWTLNERCLRQERWELPDVGLVVVDEAHAMVHETAQKVLGRYSGNGVPVVGYTATPVRLAGIYQRLIQAGTNSELRKCGALVPCTTYGCHEADLRHIRPTKIGEYREGDVTKAIMVPQIISNVYDEFLALNPDSRPTIGFGPSVAGARYFVDMFNRKGVHSALICDETVDSEREDILGGSKDGTIKVVWNRFVLREGIDMPWVAHCIMATAFGGLSNYLQAGGRLLRSFPGLAEVTLQDHGGNWHEHGSLNEDRVWHLGDTDVTLAKARKRRREAGKEQEPIRCPKCGAIRRAGPRCPFCGHEHKKSVRIVIQKDGELKHLVGNVVKHKRQKSATEKAASSAFYAAMNSQKMTVANMVGLYRKTHGHAFPDDVVRLPSGQRLRVPDMSQPEWGMRVCDVWPEAMRRKCVSKS